MAAFALKLSLAMKNPAPLRFLLPARPRPADGRWRPARRPGLSRGSVQPATADHHHVTGQLEQLQYRNQQLQQQLEKMQADYEYRLDQMEKGRAKRWPGRSPTDGRQVGLTPDPLLDPRRIFTPLAPPAA